MVNKVKIFKVDNGEHIRLMRGTLKQVNNAILAETKIEPCSPEDAHKWASVKIEDVTSEP